MEVDFRAAVFGTDSTRSLQGGFVAAALAVLVLVVSFLPLAVGTVGELGLVAVGVGLAGWWAYDNSGLAVSLALVAAPVGARLAYFWWRSRGRPAPVALPLSFTGHGAWQMWLPVALSLGVVAFVAGVVIRRGQGLIGRSPL
jgi:hypothetical protein